MITRRTTCEKCGCDKIKITWKYKKAQELAMFLCHDGYGLEWEAARMTCAKCGSKQLINKEVNR